MKDWLGSNFIINIRYANENLNANEKTLIFVKSRIQANSIWQQLREMKFSVGLII